MGSLGQVSAFIHEALFEPDVWLSLSSCVIIPERLSARSGVPQCAICTNRLRFNLFACYFRNVQGFCVCPALQSAQWHAEAMQLRDDHYTVLLY